MLCCEYSIHNVILVRFVCVKIHQYTSFNGTSIKITTIVALIEIFEISVTPSNFYTQVVQFADQNCLHSTFLSKMKGLHTTRLCYTPTSDHPHSCPCTPSQNIPQPVPTHSHPPVKIAYHP